MEAPAWRVSHRTTPRRVATFERVPRVSARTHPTPRGSSPPALPFLPTSLTGRDPCVPPASSSAHVADVRVHAFVLSLSLSIPPPRLSLFPRYRSLSQDKREEHESRSGEAGRQDAFSTPVALSRRARTRVVGRATRGDAEVGPSQEERRLRERERERDRSSSPVD